jgi:phytoene dehydrogenase-like protein
MNAPLESGRLAMRAADAIVIGAGHNGLVTAAYLAKAGLKVIVLEAADRAGGAAVTSEFAPGFRTSGVAHLLHAFHPRVAADLGLKLRTLGPRIGTTALAPEGSRIDFTSDAAGTEASIARLSPADARAFGAVMRRLIRLAEALGGYLRKTPPSPLPSANSLGANLALGLFALDLRLLGRKDFLELTRILTMNVADMAQDFFESDLLKGLLAFDATLGLFLGPRSPNTVFSLLFRLAGFGKHGMGGLYLPAGGMGSLTDALADIARRAGAEIRTEARVERILVEREAAAGVVLASGEEIRAPIVASSADPQRTLLKLLEPGLLDVQFAQRIRHLRMNGCVAKLNIALDGLPECWSGIAGRMVVAPAIDHVERAFDAAKYGGVSEHPALEIVIPTLTDPSLAPPGKHVASILTQYAPYRLRETTNDAARSQILERSLALLSQVARDLPQRIIAAEALTPQDLEASYGLTGGQWHHGEVTLDQMFFLRPAPRYQQYRMPLPGLWLCGAGAHPGGHVSGLPGANAAREILKQLRKGRRIAA